MRSLLHDRFFLCDQGSPIDLATGARVRLGEPPRHRVDGRRPTWIDRVTLPDGRNDDVWDLTGTAAREPCATETRALIEALDHAREGEPRRWVVDAHGREAVVGWQHAIAREARRRGFVPILSTLLEQHRTALGNALQDRALVLLADAGSEALAGAVALMQAAAANSRPHLLVCIRQMRGSRSAGAVRERRPDYGSAATPVGLSREQPGDWPLKAARARAWAERGRHAAAERALAEAACACERRGQHSAAVDAHVQRGQLLLGRARLDAAQAAFEAAAVRADLAQLPGLARHARGWLAILRTERGEPAEAESIARAALLDAHAVQGWERSWFRAVLGESLGAQHRVSEALDVVTPCDLRLDDSAVDPLVAAYTVRVCVDLLLRRGRHVEAGALACAALDAPCVREDTMARLQVQVALLQVAARGGDVNVSRVRLHEVLTTAQNRHAPLLALRGRHIWVELLLRAGHALALRERHRLARSVRAATPALRAAVRALSDIGPEAAQQPDAPDLCDLATGIVGLAQREADDQAAIRSIATDLVRRLRASRVDVRVEHRGASPLIAIGDGIAPTVTARAGESGIRIGPDLVHEGWECAAPITFGDRVVGAIGCRWPLGREPGRESGAVLALAAAVIAPRVDAWASEAALEAAGPTLVPEILGVSDEMDRVRRIVVKAAATPFSVLICGESGVGKELIARAIHQLSGRRTQRFCDLNCAALPDELVDTELFGHARGAFTGAMLDRRGLFESADSGTLFLDEVAELSLRAQAKLLRVLQQQEVRRVGETLTRSVDVRLVAATNRPLAEEVVAGRFRRDLLYRLDVLRVYVPPLRDRRPDIPILARHFWRGAAERAGTRASLSEAVCAVLMQHDWPGNVRELQNVIAALAVAAPARGTVRPVALPEGFARGERGVRLAEARRQLDRHVVEQALARAGQSPTRAARALGLSRQGLLKLMHRLDLVAVRYVGASEKGVRASV